MNDAYCMVYPIAIEKVVSSASSWLSFEFPVVKGDRFCWTLSGTASNPDTQFTTKISGSVHGYYNNGASFVSNWNTVHEIGAYTATANETITISSYVNGSATFRNVAVNVFRKGS